MATSPDADRFLSQFQLPAEPPWQTADEAGRLSAERFAAEIGDYGLARSRGRLRVAERGEHSQSARLEQTGRVLVALQRAVRGVGAGLEGIRAVVGNLPADVLRLTYLRLVASPAAGSVILEVQPEVSPFGEAFPEGQGTLEPPADSLADRSAAALIDVLATAEAGTDADPIAQKLAALGPRAASSIKAFADSIATGSFDIDLSWERVSHPTIQARVDQPSAAWISAIIGGRQLDAEIVALSGLLHTISDRKQLDLETDTGELLGIDRGDVEVSELHVGQQVVITALARVVVRPGGDERRTYTAIAIEQGTGST